MTYNIATERLTTKRSVEVALSNYANDEFVTERRLLLNEVGQKDE